MTSQKPFAHFERILVCTDSSAESQGAVAAGFTLGRESGCTVYLVQVLSPIPAFAVQIPDMLQPPTLDLELLKAQEQAVQTRLANYQDQARELGLILEPRLVTRASAYDGIMEEVQALAPQLLIMGRHGYTGLTRLLMGSVTARVIGHSPVNVLVAPKGAELSFKRLLVANDGSPYSAAAWEAALSLTLRLGSRLLGAAVARDEGAIPRVRQVVQDMEAEAKRRGAPLEPFLLEGQPFDAILNLARQKQATLIILGSHGRTGLKRLLMGSTAERVIGLADCPVLVVKRPAE